MMLDRTMVITTVRTKVYDPAKGSLYPFCALNHPAIQLLSQLCAEFPQVYKFDKIVNYIPSAVNPLLFSVHNSELQDKLMVH